MGNFTEELIKACKTDREVQSLMEFVFTDHKHPSVEISTFAPVPFDPTPYLKALGTIVFVWAWNKIAVKRNEKDLKEADYRVAQITQLVNDGWDRSEAVAAVNQIYDRLDKRELGSGVAKVLAIAEKMIPTINAGNDHPALEHADRPALEHYDGEAS